MDNKIEILKDFNYEEAKKELSNIVNKLEVGDMPLNESINLFERGAELSKLCQTFLNNAKSKVKKIEDEAK
ncbi:MAG: exodeoxyribonuclease VII small subunit [Mycoplasmataceae bacterium]|jgi:exodeoxyribonuclease VII small subunit|nr:exodeoxyribonuclease VII small subunit [Mycoplasmataceae bacterium]